MSARYPGGLITKTPVVPSGAYEYSSAPGIWTLEQQAYWQKLGNWPTQGNVPPPATNPPFQYVSMLLQGDGTNGAQNNTFLDSSSSVRTVTRVGTPTQGSFSPYGPNWGNYFPVGSSRGSTDLAPLVFSTITLSGIFTVEAWVFMESDNSEGNVLIASTYPGINNQFAIQVNTLKLTCFDGTANRLSTGSVTLGTWNHIAYVRDNGNTISFYINGVASGTASTSASLSLTTIAALGGYGGGIRGYISNLRVTNTQVYTGSFTPSTTPLTSVSGTQILTCQSNRFIDNGPSARTITINGLPSIQRYSPFAPPSAYSTSVIGGSGLFNTGNYLSVTGLGAIGSGDAYCYEMWIYPTEFRGGEMRFMGSGINDPLLQFSSNTDLQFFVNNTLICSYSTTFRANQWYHIAINRNAGTSYLFVNGIQRASGANGYAIANKSFFIGAQVTSPSIGLIGYMTDFRVWIGTAAYGGNFTPPTSPMTATAFNPLLLNFTDAGIFDNAMMNDLETVGGAQISTSVVKYGTGSISFDGSGDWLTIPSTPVLTYSVNNFTVELWMYSNAAPGSDAGVVDQRPDSTNGSYFMLGVNSSNRLFIYVNTDYRIGPTAATAINTAAWYHVAYVRSSGTGTLYINGNSVGTWSDTTTYLQGAGFIGHHSFSASDFNGYIDGLRITDGYAVYTANFTPPTAAFPNL